jgi:hypothetical protein
MVMKALILIPALMILGAISVFSQSGELPMLDINKLRFDFGKTKYLEDKHDVIVFKNIGDTTLNIYSIDSISSPFQGSMIYPDTLNRNDSLVFDLYYRPYKASYDSIRVFLRADTRLSHSIGLLFDISTSMDEALPGEPITKLKGADNAGASFINSMLTTPKVMDEAGVFSFSEGFYVNQDFTTNKVLLKNALPTSTVSNTAFFDACVEVLVRLEKRPYLKVLVALTDGDDNASKRYFPQDIINIAKTNKIQVYTIGLGTLRPDADNNLKNIALSTGGQYFKANSSKDLLDIYYRIFNLLSKNIELYFDLVGNCTDPYFAIQCDSLHYRKPGDTIIYQVDLKAVSVQGAMNNNYTIQFSFDKDILVPVDSNISYNGDGRLEIKGINTVNLDSFPLTNVRFMTLLGENRCSDLKLESILFNNSIPKIK